MSLVAVHSSSVVRGFLAAALVGGLFLCQTARACDTPVYRYAMYRWPPTPYVVCYFHSKPIGEEESRVHEAIKKAAETEGQPANLAFVSVNLTEDKELTSVPPKVRDTWLAREDQTSPAYLIFAPNYEHLGLVYSGDLEVGDLEAMVDSPARKKLCKQLEAGCATVFILLSGGDKKANEEAEKTVKDLVQAVNSGEIELYSSPSFYYSQDNSEDDSQEEGESDEPRKPEHEVGFLKVSRDDPKESWLVRSLMAIEDDLKDFVDDPMVFAAYGRARVLPPYIAKGITRDNMADCVFS